MTLRFYDLPWGHARSVCSITVWNQRCEVVLAAAGAASLLESELADGDTLEDPGPGVVTPLLAVGRAFISRPRPAVDLARHMAGER